MNPPQKKFCPICGSNLGPNALYCKSCGAEISKNDENNNQNLKEQTKLDEKIAKLENYNKTHSNNPQHINHLQNNHSGYRGYSNFRSIIRVPLLILVFIIFGINIFSSFNPGFKIIFNYMYIIIPIIIISLFVIIYIGIKSKRQIIQSHNLSGKINGANQTLAQNGALPPNQNLYKNDIVSSQNTHSKNKKYCHVCGKELEPGATYCKSCWADVPKDF